MIACWGMTTLEYLRACNAWEKNQVVTENSHALAEMGAPAHVPADKKAFKPFPDCVEWVIFRRKPAKKKKKSASVEATTPKVSKAKVVPATERMQEACAAANAAHGAVPLQGSAQKDSALFAAAVPEEASVPVTDSVPPAIKAEHQTSESAAAADPAVTSVPLTQSAPAATDAGHEVIAETEANHACEPAADSVPIASDQ
jgi:hypothetical protein